jgi:mannose-6-phosphate isomerase-like protein (cupin superfamily)
MPESEMIKESWQARGFTFGAWRDSANAVWQDFVHDLDELFMVVSGEMELKIADKTLRAKPGEEVLIPAGVVRSKRCVSPEGVQWYFGYRMT